MKIHHIGIIVSNIEKELALYEKLGYKKKSECIIDNIQNIKVLFIESSDGSQVLELVEPLCEKSSIYNFKTGYHHICYEVEKETESEFLENFKALKIGKIFTKPMKAIAIDNRNVVFACLQNGTFAEFVL